MSDVLSITGVIFILIGIGFATVRLGLFSAAEMATLGKFVVNLALPALIFRAVSSRPLAEIADAGYLAAVLTGSLVALGFGYFVSKRVLGGTAMASTFRAMGMSCPNSGFVGYPVMLMAMPDLATMVLALHMIVENVVIIPLILILAERARSAEVSGKALAEKIMRRLMRNPLILALGLGLAVSVFGLTLPDVLQRPVDAFASASAAVSLAVIGGTLAGLRLNSVTAAALWVVAGKLVVHPVAVAASLALFSALGLSVADERLAAAAIVMCAMPVMTIYGILSASYGEGEEAAVAMFAMTVVSFVTISATLALVLP